MNCSYYITYFRDGYCICKLDDTNCKGDIKHCRFPINKTNYENDLWKSGIVGKIKIIKNNLLHLMFKNRRNNG